MQIRPNALLFVLAAILALAPVAAPAVDTPPDPAPSPELETGRKAIEARNWDAAVKALTAAAQREPRNADVQNLLGFAYRNSGQLDAALKHYQRALQIDPRHLGAHEYIGEAYLMANNPAKAEEHLAALKRYCLAVCSERDDLNAKIASYRARSR
jgi:Flp pilus assembly protein TadD